MGAPKLLELNCPRCDAPFVENAQLVKLDGKAWCPKCGHHFVPGDHEHSANRDIALTGPAGRTRAERLADLKLRWNAPAPPAKASAKASAKAQDKAHAPAAARQPRRISEVLKTLDELLVRLDAQRRNVYTGPSDNG